MSRLTEAWIAENRLRATRQERDAAIDALPDPDLASSPAPTGLDAVLAEAEQAVRDHDAEPYPDKPDGGWYWTRDAAHLGGIVVGLRKAIALASSPAPAGLDDVTIRSVQVYDGDGEMRLNVAVLGLGDANDLTMFLGEVTEMDVYNDEMGPQARASVLRAATRPAEPNHRHPGGDNATCPACAATRPAEDAGERP